MRLHNLHPPVLLDELDGLGSAASARAAASVPVKAKPRRAAEKIAPCLPPCLAASARACVAHIGAGLRLKRRPALEHDQIAVGYGIGHREEAGRLPGRGRLDACLSQRCRHRTDRGYTRGQRGDQQSPAWRTITLPSMNSL